MFNVVTFPPGLAHSFLPLLYTLRIFSQYRLVFFCPYSLLHINFG
jgi:hypothetical protein